MPVRGGKREGAGRKKGALTKRTQEIAAQAAAEGITPLEVMLGAMRTAWENADHEKAATFAKDAAPYVHPRLAAIEHKGDQDNPLSFVVLSAVPRPDDEEEEDMNGHSNGHASHN